MNPDYQFTINGRTVHPYYKSDLSVDTKRESSRYFFRTKLSGKLEFLREDFDFIDGSSINTEFRLTIRRRVEGTRDYADFFTGRFYKTDCEFDRTNRIVSATVEALDGYVDVLKNYDAEENFLELGPARVSVKTFVRPLLEVYMVRNGVGSSKVTLFQGGRTWEKNTEIQPVDDQELMSRGFRRGYQSTTIILDRLLNYRVDIQATTVRPSTGCNSRSSRSPASCRRWRWGRRHSSLPFRTTCRC